MRIPCEFFLIRYVPDARRGEFANIGVMLREAGRPEVATVRLTRNWSRVRCLDRDADVEMLEALEWDLQARLRDRTPKPAIEMLEEMLSNSVQIAPARASLAESLPAELDLLMSMYVEQTRSARTAQTGGRAAIAASMRREFERAGVWELLRKRIAAAQYTRTGDPLRIDCGYRPNGTVRMFQAVSLRTEAESAKALAFTAPRLREGVLRVEGAELDLTAIVEPWRTVSEDADAQERYKYGIASMEEQQIRVMTVSDLGRMAETAKRELRMT